MRQEIFNPNFIFVSKILSGLLNPIYFFLNLFKTKSSYNKDKIKTIVITEYYCIGDIYIILPAVESLHKHFFNAKIILICSIEAEPIAKNIEFFDEVIPFNAPWKEKPLNLIRIWQARDFARSLRDKDIDLAIDFRGDIRNNWFLYQIKSKYSIGYNFTGGHYFIDKANIFPHHLHQKDRALNLVNSIGVKPFIKRKEQKRNQSGYIVLHPGAGDSRRTWSNKLWIELIKILSNKHKIAIVKVPETKDLIDELKTDNKSMKIFSGDLIDFNSWLKNQRLLVGPDSMAGHLAAYLNIPVVSIFGSQNPELTKPIGFNVKVLKPNGNCKHNRKHWRLCRECINMVKPSEVFNVINQVLKIK